MNEIIKQQLSKFDELYKSFNWLVKYSDYTQEYRCSDDCQQAGCPAHTATFSISHATDTYSIDWGTSETIYLDGERMALLLQFAEKISEKGKLFLTKALTETWNASREDTVENLLKTYECLNKINVIESKRIDKAASEGRVYDASVKSWATTAQAIIFPLIKQQ